MSRTDAKNFALRWYWKNLKEDRPHLNLYEKICPRRWPVPGKPRSEFDRVFNYVMPPDELDDLIDRRWLSILPALNEVFQDFRDVPDDWQRIENLMEQRSISQARIGRRSLLNARTIMVGVPLSKRERRFIVDRAEGQVKYPRGRKTMAPGRYAFARLWLEIVEGEKSADVATFRVAKFYEIGESFVRKGVQKSNSDGMYSVMSKYLCGCCEHEFGTHFARSIFF